MTPPASVEQCKAALLADEQPEPGGPPSPRDWLIRHPAAALVLAAGAGTALIFFPRVRKLAIPLAVAMVKRSMM